MGTGRLGSQPLRILDSRHKFNQHTDILASSQESILHWIKVIKRSSSTLMLKEVYSYNSGKTFSFIILKIQRLCISSSLIPHLSLCITISKICKVIPCHSPPCPGHDLEVVILLSWMPKRLSVMEGCPAVESDNSAVPSATLVPASTVTHPRSAL